MTPPSPSEPKEEDAAATGAPLPPLTPASLILTLLQSTMLAVEDGQAERKYNYVLW